MTFIVAEVGSNWSSLIDCLDSIGMAKNCGADAIKYQLFTRECLYGYGNPEVRLYELDPAWLPKLKAEADHHGIEFMCTAFSPEGVDLVDPYIKRHKIASAELSHAPLLERVRGKNKPVLLSTGGSSLTDVNLALNMLGENTTLLYCVSAYPAKDINLYGIDLLRNTFPRRVGYSCHSADIATSVSAVHYHQAVVIEKHFKLRADMDTPDSQHSLCPQKFKKMVKMIRGNPCDHVTFPSHQEEDMLFFHNRRLIVTKPIKCGEMFKYDDNFGVYRSLSKDVHAITGFAYGQITGKFATKDLSPGDPIGPRDFS